MDMSWCITFLEHSLMFVYI